MGLFEIDSLLFKLYCDVVYSLELAWLDEGVAPKRRSYYAYTVLIVFLFEATSGYNPESPDAASVASSIKYHAEFTPLFSPEKFELPKAFCATAHSVRDKLIINWIETYNYYEKLNVKQAYYLSMEFLQVRPDLLF